MSKNNFMKRCLTGEILSQELEEALDDEIDNWHESTTGQSLHDFLGMTREQLDLVVEKPYSLQFVVFSKEQGLSLDEAASFLDSDQLAARGCSPQEGKEILDWLRKKGHI